MPDPAPSSGDETARRALAIAAALAVAGPGEKAETRRMGPEGAPVFWRQVARLGIRPHEEGAWLRFTRMIALMTPATRRESIHETGRKLGAVLADGGDMHRVIRLPDKKPVVSEVRLARLARLAAARGPTRLDALERAIRMIVRNRPQLDVTDLAQEVLARRPSRLVADYYRRTDRFEKKEAAND